MVLILDEERNETGAPPEVSAISFYVWIMNACIEFKDGDKEITLDYADKKSWKEINKAHANRPHICRFVSGYVVKSMHTNNGECLAKLKNGFNIMKKIYKVDATIVPEPIDRVIVHPKRYFIYTDFGKGMHEAAEKITKEEIERLLKSISDLGITHDDAHPGNIVTRDGEFRLIDFDDVDLKQATTENKIHAMSMYKALEEIGKVRSSTHSDDPATHSAHESTPNMSIAADHGEIRDESSQVTWLLFFSMVLIVIIAIYWAMPEPTT